jgi:lysophospholipase L1-like esterase
MNNGLYNGQLNGMPNGLFNGMDNGLHNGLYSDGRIVTSSPIGQLFYDDFARGSLGSDYAQNGSRFSTDGSKLNTTAGTGVWTDYIVRIANPTCLERHTITADFKCTSTLSASTHGLAFGVRSGNPSDIKTYALQVACNSGANNGKCALYTADGTTPTYTSRLLTAQLVAINTNDLLRIVITRNQLNISWTLYNLTTGAVGSASYNFVLTYSATAFAPHNTGYFCINALGAVNEIYNFKAVGNDLKNPDVLWRGDSITAGYFAGSIGARFGNQSINQKTAFCVLAGASDKTAELLLNINELLLIRPKVCVLMIGGNDVFYSVPDATMKANIILGCQKMRAKGIRIIHCLSTPRDIVDVTALNTWIKATFSSVDTVVDTYTPLWSGTGTGLNALYQSGDAGVHPNALGNWVISQTVSPFLTRYIN